MKAIDLQHITKRFGDVIALDDVSLEVNKGQLFGLIGPDGAGKTTLIRIITSLMVPDEGQATILGFDTNSDYMDIRKRLGYMPGRFSLYPDLSVEENLNFFATIFGSTFEENRHLIEDIYKMLEPFKKRRAGALSGGMKQKLALCCALIHKPDLLILDEPTTGVDAVSRREFWDMLDTIKAEGIPILVSTPYMDEAERCDEIALMQNGKVLAKETPKTIRESYVGNLFAVSSTKRYELLKSLRTHPAAHSVHPFGDSVHFTTMNDSTSVEELNSFIQQQGFSDGKVRTVAPDIEDCFMALLEETNA